MKHKTISRKDFNKLKAELLEEQNWECPVSGVKLEVNKESVLDHQHKLFKNQPLGENGAGFIRGVLHYQANAWEGKVFNAFRRLGLHKFDRSLPAMLRALADYLENSITEYVHPSELPRPKKLGKRDFNKIAKLYKNDNPTKPVLEYPKSGKPTKKIKELADKYGVEL